MSDESTARDLNTEPATVWEWGVRFDGEDVLPLSEGSARRQAGAAGEGQPRLVRRRVGEWEAAP